GQGLARWCVAFESRGGRLAIHKSVSCDWHLSAGEPQSDALGRFVSEGLASAAYSSREWTQLHCRPCTGAIGASMPGSWVCRVEDLHAAVASLGSGRL